MSTSRGNDFYNTYGSRRSPQATELQTTGFFQAEKGGRTVLPPISTAFPTSHFPVDNYSSQHYSQPRSSGSPARNYDPGVMYGSYTPSIPPTYYDQDYSLQPQYNSYTAPPRSMNNNPAFEPSHSRRHATPPPATYSGMEDRWSNPAYPTTASHHTSSSTLYTPAASYPQHYSQHHHHPDSYTSNPYPTHDHIHVSTNPNESRGHPSSTHRSGTPARAGTRGPSPGRASIQSPTSPTYLPPSHHGDPSQAQQEAAVKKKRRRADANQLKILNEVWDRTAFPSTEERAELAKRLEMSPRSVQIWFQNKRQNLRQSTRQSNMPPHQPFAASPTDEYPEDTHYRSSATSNQPPLIGHSTQARSSPVASSSTYRRGRS